MTLGEPSLDESTFSQIYSRHLKGMLQSMNLYSQNVPNPASYWQSQTRQKSATPCHFVSHKNQHLNAMQNEISVEFRYTFKDK